MNAIDSTPINVSELSLDEVKKVQGGYVGPWIPFLITYVVIQIATNPVSHWESFKRGFEAGYNL